eukprot:g13677.t1
MLMGFHPKTTGAAAALAIAGLTLGAGLQPAAAQSASGQNAAGAAQAAVAEIAPDKRRKIERILDLTRVDRTVEAMAPLAAQQTAQMLDQNAPGMSETERESLMQTASNAFHAGRDELAQALIPVYAKTFSVEELDHMLAFYDTPAGQSIADKLPRAVGAAQQITRAWSQGVARQAMQQVKQEASELGYSL